MLVVFLFVVYTNYNSVLDLIESYSEPYRTLVKKSFYFIEVTFLAFAMCETFVTLKRLS